MRTPTKKWPKTQAKLTPDQENIRNDFVKLWHQILPNKYRLIELFNHKYVILASPSYGNTLEIGSGLGEHIYHEKLNDTEYYTLELRTNMSKIIKKRFPQVHVTTGDCQKKTNFKSNFFDRIIAIHVLEHLQNLPAALKEAYRLLKSDGKFIVVIPCEGGNLYNFSRRVSAQRIFENKYHQSYRWFIQSEHINMSDEITEELNKLFTISNRIYFPFLIPSVNINLCIGMTLKKKTLKTTIPNQ